MEKQQSNNWTKVYLLVLGFLALQILVYSLISNYYG